MSAYINLGFLESKSTQSKFPLLIPIDLHGILVVNLDQSTKKYGFSQIEGWLLDAINKEQPIRIIKISNQLSEGYPALALLCPCNIVEDYAGLNAASQGLDRVTKEAFRRRNIISQHGTRNITNHNKISSEQIPIYSVLLPDLDECLKIANASIGLSAFIDLISSGQQFGFIFLFVKTRRLQLDQFSNSSEIDNFIEVIGNHSLQVRFEKKQLYLERLHPVINKIIESTKYKFNSHYFDTDQNMRLARSFIDKHKENELFESKDFLRISTGTALGKKHYFALGRTSQAYHAAITGMIGSGKSTFIRNFIIEVLEKYSHQELNIHLIDLKRAMDSNIFLEYSNKIITGILEIEPTYEVIDRLIDSYKKIVAARFDQCRALNTVSIDHYNEKCLPEQKIPYLIVVIDEAHKIFSLTESAIGNYRLAERIQWLLQESRAAGVHFIFCSQTFSKSGFTDVTREQIKVRVAFKAGSSMASELFVGSNAAFNIKNDARNGIYKFIYNDDSGHEDFNAEVVAHNYDEVDFLKRLSRLTDRSYKTPVIDLSYFSGDEVNKENKISNPPFDEDKYNDATKHMLNSQLKDLGNI